jgi:1,4-dihydroxy-2-naphthoyl-CoA hydrolase
MNTVFNPRYTFADLGQIDQNTMVEHLGIEYVALEHDHLIAKMPVDHRTKQPFGLLHGGASAVLSETLGSVAAWLTLPDPDKQRCVGVEINANHLKAATSGYVYGRCSPLHVGRRMQVWETRITNENDDLVCVSRLTVMVIDVK